MKGKHRPRGHLKAGVCGSQVLGHEALTRPAISGFGAQRGPHTQAYVERRLAPFPAPPTLRRRIAPAIFCRLRPAVALCVAMATGPAA